MTMMEARQELEQFISELTQEERALFQDIDFAGIPMDTFSLSAILQAVPEEMKDRHASKIAKFCKLNALIGLKEPVRSGRGLEDPNATDSERRAVLVGEVMKTPLQTFRDTEETLFWQGGKYHPGGDVLIKEKVQKVGKFQITNRMRSEVTQTVKILTYVDRTEFDRNPDILNLQNGLLNIQTGEFMQHTPDYLSQIQIPVNYDPAASCPAFVKFLKETLEPAHIAIVVKLLGYLLLRKAIYEKAFMFYGDGSNGKSTLIKTLITLLGRGNCSNRSLQALTSDRFAKADLYNKMANFFLDLPASSILDAGDFKILVSGDRTSAERKHQQPFNFENYAKLIFSANRLPEAVDRSYAYYRRWVIIPFPRVFEGDEKDEKLLEKLTTEQELSGILNLALKGLAKLQAERGFDDVPIEDVRSQYDLGASRIRTFLQEKCIVEPGNDSLFEESSRLREAYRSYCREKKAQYFDERKFGEELKALAVSHKKKQVNKRRVYCDFGIKLKGSEVSKCLDTFTTFPVHKEIVQEGVGAVSSRHLDSDHQKGEGADS